MDKYVVLEKKVGQTPLEVVEAHKQRHPELLGVPLAYAGRLDPMASGKLLILLGEECKKQEEYHHLDKEYKVVILFGTHSDSGDVLGIVSEHQVPEKITPEAIITVLKELVGEIEFPYPVFSSKTVQGKPLHTWAVENRLHEITIPTRRSMIYSLTLDSLSTLTRQEVLKEASAKIESIPPVTDPRKALGNDFRRPLVREAWHSFSKNGGLEDTFYVAHITCICSSGSYMRTLAELIAEKLKTKGLAFGIHRTTIGNFDSLSHTWTKCF